MSDFFMQSSHLLIAALRLLRKCGLIWDSERYRFFMYFPDALCMLVWGEQNQQN